MKTSSIYSCFVMLLFFTSSYGFTTTRLNLKEAVIISNKQKILAQKAAKVYIGLCNNTKDVKLYQERDAVINEFKENLYQLGTFTPTDPIRNALSEVKLAWKDYVAIVGWSIKKDDGAKLLKQLDRILQTTQKLHRQYLSYEASLNPIKPTSYMLATNDLVKQNENQKILIERILLYYLAEKSGVAAVESGHKLEEANTTFSTLLNSLMSQRMTTQSIQEKYQNLKKTWSGISKHLVFTSKKQQDHLDDMYLRADKISSIVDEIIILQHDLGKALSVSQWLTDINNNCLSLQELTKMYIALPVVSDSIKYVYKKAIFDRTNSLEQAFVDFENIVPNVEMKELVRTQINKSWVNYKQLLSSKANDDNIKTLLEQNNTILNHWDKIRGDVYTYSSNIEVIKELEQSEEFGIASNQGLLHPIERMGTLQIRLQTIAINYFYTPINTKNTLEEDIYVFKKAYEALIKYPHNTTAKQKILISVKKEWKYIEAAAKDKENHSMEEFLAQSELLGKKLNKLNKLYLHQLKKVIQQQGTEKQTEQLSIKN